MPDWEWDWHIKDKFRVICGEFGGLQTVTTDRRMEVCTLRDHDDFKSFVQWMDRQSRGLKNVQLKAEYNDDARYPSFGTTKVFTLDGIKPKKTLTVSNERGLSDWSRDITLSDVESKAIIDKIKKPYLKNNANVRIFLLTSSMVEQRYFAEATVSLDVEHGVISSILDDADEAVEDMTNRAQEAFNAKLKQRGSHD